jgi:hypothetical protein
VDSYEFAARNYGDLAFRIWGRWFRHIFNVLQAIQLTLSVGLIVISNGHPSRRSPSSGSATLSAA